MQPDGPRYSVQLHQLPARRGPNLEAHRRRLTVSDLEITVVAEANQGIADGRVDDAVGQPRGAQRSLDRGSEQRTYPQCRSAGGIQPAQLRIRPKAAAGQVDRLELGPNSLNGGVEAAIIGGYDSGDSAQRCELGCCQIHVAALGLRAS